MRSFEAMFKTSLQYPNQAARFKFLRENRTRRIYGNAVWFWLNRI